MKSLLLIAFFLIPGITVIAQLRSSTQNQCTTFIVDILDGKVNGVEADFTPGEIKK